MAVVDASVWVARLHAADPAHAQCTRWFDEAVRRAEPIAAPVIVLPEVAAAIGRQTGSLRLADAAVALLLSAGIELCDVTPLLARSAATIAGRHRVRGCDAVYIALAMDRGESLVTLDREQRERGTAVVSAVEP